MTFLLETIQAGNETEIHRFYRDEFGKKHKEIVRGFRPYLYVDENVDVPSDYRITSVETGHKTLFGDKVKKIFVKQSRDVVGVRELFEKHYEADILFTQRYIIDVLGESEIYKLHMLSIDIETDTKNVFPNIEDPDQAITSCAFSDNNGLKRKYIYKSPECKEDIIVDENTRVFKTEEQLLEGIIALIKQNDPDIITGWAITSFDLPYLINRMRKLKIRYSNMSPLDMVFCKKNEYTGRSYEVAIRGRIVMDGLDAYMHFRKMSNQGRAESYSLEFTAQSVLGIGKIKHEEGFHEMWINNPNKLITYNLRDAELVIQILEKLEIIDFFNYIRSKASANLSQIYRMTSLVDGYLLRRAHNKYVLPSKNKKSGDKYSGAFVFPPIPGLYKNIIALDLKALYVNIIKSFNISPETFNPDGEIKLKDGIAFDKGIGLMSQIMRELDKERAIYKKLMWKADKDGDKEKQKLNYFKQYAVKVLTLSFYGYLGHSRSRLYKKEVAEAITEWGVKIIKWSQEVLEYIGYEIIYGDTDSIFVKSKSSGLFSLLKEGKKLTNVLNKSYTKFCKDFGSNDCTLEMEFEKIFKKVLFVGKKGGKNGEIVGAKKKYAYILLWEDKKQVDNSVKFTGFEFVRSDSCRVTRKTQHDIVEMILNGITKEELTAKLRKIDTDIRSKKIPTEEIAFPRGISKKLNEYGINKVNKETGESRKTGTPPVVAGCRYSNNFLGTRLGQGSKPMWLYIKSVPYGYPNTKVLSFTGDDIPEGFIVDYDIMIEKILKLKLEEILIASGFGSFPNTDVRQQTL